MWESEYFRSMKQYDNTESDASIQPLKKLGSSFTADLSSKILYKGYEM